MTSAAATATVGKSSAATGDSQRPRVVRPGPLLHTNSLETKRLATAILEVLAGLRTPRDAAKTLNISLPRYYLLEQRALTGLLAACEPRSKGPRRSAEQEIAKIQRELACCQRECTRQQSLLRAAQRTMGLAAAQPSKSLGKNGVQKRRRRRPAARALRAARAIEVNSPGTFGPDGVQPLAKSGEDRSDAVAPRPSDP